ncbi:SET domain-containing protein [Xylariaceae sp. FL0594]|nr:SET domain-containing protein [Xylariaceae sp. FL0594]
MPKLPEGLALSGTATLARGRSITASRAFKPGDLIATFDSPSIAIPDSPHLLTTCSGCLLPARPDRVVRACTGCRAVAYCSPACQKLDWTRGGHKAECTVFKRVKAEGNDFIPTTVRALVQVLARPELAAAVAELQGHTDEFRKGSGTFWENAELQAMAALHYLGHEANPRNLASAMDIVCKLQINSFNRLDQDLDQAGLFLNPALAMVNHSCIPNAFVQFAGRQAILHAYQEIKIGEEIQISYIDCNTHRRCRQEALISQYRFTCDCLRCKDDMDVYQVFKVYPHLHLNNHRSLAPDIQREGLITPGPLSEDKSLRDIVEATYPRCSSTPIRLAGAEKGRELHERWKAVRPIARKFMAHAIEPVPCVLTEAGVYFVEQDNFAYSLCITSFLAMQVDPFKTPAPFAPHRVKSLLMIAKLIANAAYTLQAGGAEPGALVSAETLPGKISQVLRAMDCATVSQVLLELVLAWSPAAHSKKWSIFQEAQELLADLESLPGRETEDSYVKAFLQNPAGVVERRFFLETVHDPLHKLSEYCPDIMDSEFDS